MTPDRQILFIQGGGKDVHEAWDRKLVDSLTRELGAGYDVRYPRLPSEDDPTFARWKPALVKELAALDDGAIVVAHSVGATTLLHTLVEQTPKTMLRAVLLIAPPFIGGDGGWPSDEITSKTSFAVPRELAVFLYHGTADATVSARHVQLYTKAIPNVVVRSLDGRDHQLNDDLSEVARDIHALS